MRDKILASHMDRKAAVYVRQSSLKQVVEHSESTERQYRLRERAAELGWPVERIDVIDCDLGVSGKTVQARSGFQRLAEDVAHGRVGAIFALEVSRLARSSADWHRLLELCTLADVVIADEQGVYAPRNYDDRLLLGLKGTMSEAEQYWMKLRLQGGALSKAQRGELYKQPPVGYEWDRKKNRLVLYPDERVQKAVRLVFERFRIDSSAGAVVRYFSRNGLELPTRDPVSREVRWRIPRRMLVINMLHNPIYAGAYVYGCRKSGIALVNGEVKRHEVRWLPPSEWKVCLREHHPGYIGWDEFMSNREKLDANRSNHKVPQERGAAREGAALLQGLLLCGRCGYRMQTQYRTTGNRASYLCKTINKQLGLPGTCWSVSARDLDRAVVDRFLAVAAPNDLELTLAVAGEVEKQVQEISKQWELKLERARYEARHAERRYKAVDPDNRTVARTLETEWNDALTALEAMEAEKADAEQRLRLTLTEADKRRIRELARNLPAVWAASSTTPEERKNLLRLVIREITVRPVDVPTRATQVKILWQNESVEEFFVQRAVSGRERKTPQVLPLDVIRSFMASGETDAMIATKLNQQGVHTAIGREWTGKAVERFRSRNGLTVRINKGKRVTHTATSNRGFPR